MAKVYSNYITKRYYEIIIKWAMNNFLTAFDWEWYTSKIFKDFSSFLYDARIIHKCYLVLKEMYISKAFCE